MSSRKPPPSGKSRRSPPPSKSRRSKSHTTPKGRKPRKRWFSILLFFLSVAIVCGTIGFLFTKIFIIK